MDETLRARKRKKNVLKKIIHFTNSIKYIYIAPYGSNKLNTDDDNEK